MIAQLVSAVWYGICLGAGVAAGLVALIATGALIAIAFERATRGR